MLKMTAQRGRRRSSHRRRTLWGTLRMAASREQSWRSFSAFVLNGAEDREQIAQRNRLVLQDCPRPFNIVRHGALPACL
jgi:hypothetical protein